MLRATYATPAGHCLLLRVAAREGPRKRKSKLLPDSDSAVEKTVPPVAASVPSPGVARVVPLSQGKARCSERCAGSVLPPLFNRRTGVDQKTKEVRPRLEDLRRALDWGPLRLPPSVR